MGAWLESVRSKPREYRGWRKGSTTDAHSVAISAYFERMCLPLHELQVAYLVLPGAANNSSISARSKNSTVRRTQRLPEIAKILWQRSMGVVSFFRLPANRQCMHCVVFSRFLVQL